MFEEIIEVGGITYTLKYSVDKNDLRLTVIYTIKNIINMRKFSYKLDMNKEERKERIDKDISNVING